jgi:hypothetical protein
VHKIRDELGRPGRRWIVSRPLHESLRYCGRRFRGAETRAQQDCQVRSPRSADCSPGHHQELPGSPDSTYERAGGVRCVRRKDASRRATEAVLRMELEAETAGARCSYRIIFTSCWQRARYACLALWERWPFGLR